MTDRVTAIILNYNRDKNLPQIVEAIRKQSVPADVWIWDNSGCGPVVMNLADVMIRSTYNFMCHPRLVLSGMARTPFVWWNDDDRVIADPDLFKKLLDEALETGADLLGINGKNFDDPRVDWEKPYQSPGWAPPGHAKFVNTGFSMIRTQALTRIPLNLYMHGFTENDIRFGDDMIISSYVANNIVSKHIEPANRNISEHGIGLSHMTDHMNVRNRLCRTFWGPQ